MTEPVLLLPGLACDARVFFHQLVTLALNRPVTALPLTGALVEDMSLAVPKDAPARFALADHGLGGTTALDVVRRAPDRVTRIILISNDPLSETPQAAVAREARMFQARAGRLREMIQGEVPASVLHDGPSRADVL
jgi:pimeloyl-ACP methyl ester carboxylesterase